MKTITLNIPDFLEIDNIEAAALLSTKLYEQGKLSLGEAAELTGKSKKEFMKLLDKYGVSVFNSPHSDIAQDLENA